MKLIESDIESLTSDFNEKFPDLKLYHGSNSKKIPQGTCIKFKFRTTSKSTPPLVNYLINKRLESIYGIPIRNLIYATRVLKNAKSYGNVHKLVPCGDDYRLFYCKNVTDFTADFQVFPEEFAEMMRAKVQDKIDSDIRHEILYRLPVLLRSNNDDELSKYEETIKKSIDKSLISDRDIEAVFGIYLNAVNERVDDIISNYDLIEISESLSLPTDEEIMCYFPSGFVVK